MPHRGPNHEGTSVVEVTRVWLAITLRFAAETPLVTLSALAGGLVEFGCGQNGTVKTDNYLFPSLLIVEAIQVFCYPVGGGRVGSLLNFQKKRFAEMYGSTLLELRGGGRVSNFQKKGFIIT